MKKIEIDKKIFVGPVEIAGYARNLAKGFRELGYQCDNISFERHTYEYSQDENIPSLIKLSRFFRNLNKLLIKIPFLNFLCILISEIFNSLWSILAIFKYDVFIFIYGKSLLRFNLDLPILKFFGKTVISNLSFGSEARPPYIDGFTNLIEKSGKHDYLKIARSSKIKSRMIRFHFRYCSYVIGGLSSTSQFATQPFINSFIVGFPLAFEKNIDNPILERRAPNALSILHAPTHLKGKGTSKIVNAIENLKKKGYSIELKLIQNMPNHEVIKAIKACDFVVDQTFSDTPMAGLVSEAALHEKPSIVGGYGLKYLKSYINQEFWPPVKECSPDNIEQAIEEFIINKDQRLKIGSLARKYAVEKRSSLVIAKYFIRIIDNDIPNKWWFDPKDINFTFGAGQTEDETKDIVKTLISKYGDVSLDLEHNKILKKLFLEVAKDDN